MPNIKDIYIKLVGIEDQFGRSACNIDDLMKIYGLSEENIISSVKEILNIRKVTNYEKF